MRITVWILGVIPYLPLSFGRENVGNAAVPVNISDSNNDMYVIHAMVYQVGIITNKTDNETSNMNTTGNQETLTFYHNDGAKINLSEIAEPLLTNVTAQSVVGITPTSGSNDTSTMPWSTLKQFVDEETPSQPKHDSESAKKMARNVQYEVNAIDNETGTSSVLYKIFKREAFATQNFVKITNGSAVIPEAAGVHSVAIPPLLALNNNYSEIPVPIPNTSVVHYAKINTLISKP